jgi:putative transposase
MKAKLRLAERMFRCDQSLLVLDRDLTAARNLAQLVDEVSGRHVLPELAWATVNEPEANPHQTRTTRAAGTATGKPTPTGAGQRRRGNAPTQDTFSHVS